MPPETQTFQRKAQSGERPISEPPRRQILSGDQIDSVADALLVVASELWATTDRLRILEQVLTAHGIDAQHEIDRFAVSRELETELDLRRDAFIAAILAALNPS